MLQRGDTCYLSLVFRNQRNLEATDHPLPMLDLLNAILELVESGRVLEGVVPSLVVNPLSVSVQATGKKRLINLFKIR